MVDYEQDGITIEETVELCRRLEAEGVDVIHCSGGHHALMQYEVSPWYMPRVLHRWGWEQIKAAVSIPVIASGSIVAPDVAADIVASGSADFVSLGRPLLADPDWPLKTQQGRMDDITPCIRCNDGCLHRGLNVGRSAGCTVNPSMGEEYRYPIEKAQRSERIAVVGGGPAGMNAARVLAERGHHVVLFEQARLGGQLNTAVRHDLKKDLRALLAHLIHRLEGVQVVSRQVTAQELVSAGFERVMLATGRKPVPFQGPVSDARVLMAHEISDRSQVEGPVVVIGAGMTGCDTALWLQAAGTGDVTLIDSADRVLSQGYVFTDEMGMPDLLSDHGIQVRTNTRAISIDSKGVTVQDDQEREEVLAARTVVVACGYAPCTELADELATLAPGLPVHLIGTAARDGRVMDALHDSFFVARRC